MSLIREFSHLGNRNSWSNLEERKPREGAGPCSLQWLGIWQREPEQLKHQFSPWATSGRVFLPELGSSGSR